MALLKTHKQFKTKNDETAIHFGLKKNTKKTKKRKFAWPTKDRPKKVIKPEVSGGQGDVLVSFNHGKKRINVGVFSAFPKNGGR